MTVILKTPKKEKKSSSSLCECDDGNMPKPPIFEKIVEESGDETLKANDGPTKDCCCRKYQQLEEKMDSMKTTMDHILRNILIMKAVQGRSTENMSNSGSEPVSQELKKILGTCPINRDEDLTLLEDFLKTREHFACAAQQFSSIGGDSLYEFVKRILQKIMTNALAINFNLQGRGEKESFCGLNTSKLILESTKKSRFSTSTDKEIESSVGKWLRRAKERDTKKSIK